MHHPPYPLCHRRQRLLSFPLSQMGLPRGPSAHGALSARGMHQFRQTARRGCARRQAMLAAPLLRVTTCATRMNAVQGSGIPPGHSGIGSGRGTPRATVTAVRAASQQIASAPPGPVPACVLDHFRCHRSLTRRRGRPRIRSPRRASITSCRFLTSLDDRCPTRTFSLRTE